MITTVLGEIGEDELGVASSHEHIFIDMRNCVDITGNESAIFYEKFKTEHRAEVHLDPYAVLDNALQDGIDNAVYELEYFKAFGGQTIIDCTLDEIGMDMNCLIRFRAHDSCRRQNLFLVFANYCARTDFADNPCFDIRSVYSL